MYKRQAKDIQKQLNTGKIDFGFIRADVNTEPDQKLGSFLFLLDENILACEPLGLPVMPLNSQKFLVKALWKKDRISQEAELFIRLLKAGYLEK